MELEIISTGHGGQPVQHIKDEAARIERNESPPKPVPPPPVSPIEEWSREKVDVEQILKDIMNMSSAFNRRLKFSINYQLNEVIVKVVDAETDKVIREVPPEEIRRLHSRMKETIGLLFDKEI
ncbi:MAG: flagellar protein FlaG [Spirochaetales bacterium]|nr:flagellar protein FlaG [Spirochaetales bacterium]